MLSGGCRTKKGLGWEERGGEKVGDDREHFKDGLGNGSGEAKGFELGLWLIGLARINGEGGGGV